MDFIEFYGFRERTLEAQANREFLLQQIRQNIKNFCLRDRQLFELTLYTPVSCLDVINLNISDINLVERSVSLKRDDRTFQVPITLKCATLLHETWISATQRDSPLFLNNEGQRLSLYNLWSIKVNFSLELNS